VEGGAVATLPREVQKIGRCWIDGPADRALGEIGIACPQPPFRRVVRGKIEPWCDARHQAAEGFQMRDALTARLGGLFHRHPGLQRSAGKIRQDRFGQPLDNASPDASVRHRRRGLAGLP
jgi:hypothetical protein